VILEVTMARPIEIRSDIPASLLRQLAARTRDAGQARRLLAITAGLEGGVSRAAAAAAGGMDRQTLRDWIIRYNASGPDGLMNRPSPGRPLKLTEAGHRELEALVARGPDPDADGVVRWRCTDLKRVLSETRGEQVSASTVRRALKKLKYSWISARPRHPAQKPDAVAAFKKTSPA
jgi:transposase